MEKVNNMFAVQKPQQNAMTESSSQREISGVQMAALMAKTHPRNEAAAMDKIIDACCRPGLAEKAIYSYAKGGTAIEGPSVNLARAIAKYWQNIDYGIREIEQKPGESVMEAYAWDLENNVRESRIFTVQHTRYKRGGGSVSLEDPRDIYEATANNGARRVRACLLDIIPDDVVEAAIQQCNITLQSNEEITPESTAKMLAAFDKMGVKKDHIEKRIQRRMDAITPALMANLRKIYNSIREGISKPADWFDLAPVVDESLKESVKANAPA
jgi:hypothetical protein